MSDISAAVNIIAEDVEHVLSFLALTIPKPLPQCINRPIDSSCYSRAPESQEKDPSCHEDAENMPQECYNYATQENNAYK